MTAKKSNNILVIAVIVIVLLVLLAGFFIHRQHDDIEEYFQMNGDYLSIYEGNASDSSTLAVSMKETSGPTEILARVAVKDENSGTWIPSVNEYTLTSGAENNPVIFAIPQDSEYRLEVKAVQGKNGYASFDIENQ